MKYTRVNTKKLLAHLQVVLQHLDEIEAELEPDMDMMTDEDRQTIVKPRAGFDEAVRMLVATAANHPEIAAATGFDSAAVIEDLDNLKALLPLEARINTLARLVADTRLQWAAEAYVPALQFYGVAKVRAKVDPKLQQTIAPLAEVFQTARKRKEHKEEE